MNKFSKNSGYIGLILMLITVLIMALLVWKFGLFNPTNASSSSKGNDIESNLSLEAIKQAETVKKTLEARDRQMAR